MIPKGLAAQLGEEQKTVCYLPLATTVYPLIAFIEGGRYLYGSRAVPREGW